MIVARGEEEPMPRPLDEQVVVITGASSEIGREAALSFGRCGASLALAARNEEALQATADEVERLGGRAFVVPTDVSDWEAVRTLADRAVERFGRLDTWVNAAAVSLYGTVEELCADEIRRVIEVILLGEIHGMKAAVVKMRPRGSGVIVNVASILGKRGVPLQAAYCAAKHGNRRLLRGPTPRARAPGERSNRHHRHVPKDAAAVSTCSSCWWSLMFAGRMFAAKAPIKPSARQPQCGPWPSGRGLPSNGDYRPAMSGRSSPGTSDGRVADILTPIIHATRPAES
jgi:hypothetical protein